MTRLIASSLFLALAHAHAADIVLGRAQDFRIPFPDGPDAVASFARPPQGIAGMAAWWTFDETGDTTTFADASGHGADLVSQNNAQTAAAAGVFSGAMTFGPYAAATNWSASVLGAVNGGAYSISFWFQRADPGAHCAAFTGDGPDGWWMVYYNADLKSFNWYDAGPGGMCPRTIVCRLAGAAWTHVVLWVSGAEHRAYINGSLQGVWYGPGVPTGCAIGRFLVGQFDTFDNTCTFDDVRFFDHALAPGAVAALTAEGAAALPAEPAFDILTFDPADPAATVTPAWIAFTESGSYSAGNYDVFPVPTPVDGYAFAGWYTEPGGGGYQINPWDCAPGPGNLTLYAYWVQN